jgi:hypothetical protein
MNCCKQCFVESSVVKEVRQTARRGGCDFCKARRVQCVPASALYDLFRPVVALFEPCQDGKHFRRDLGGEATRIGKILPDCIESKNGEAVFCDRLSDETKCALLDEIRCLHPRSGDNDSIRSDELWVSSEQSLYRRSEEDIWFEFAETIKWKRRFIPDAIGEFLTNPKDWLPQYLDDIAYFTSPEDTYYRARLGGVEVDYVVRKPFLAADMGVPPKTRVTAGRANPAGIPYLYVAEKEQTAVSEIRPFLGGKVTVASVRPRNSLQVVDLTEVRPLGSLFGHEELKMELEKNALLSILNRELSKPINPTLVDVEYVPTQYLAEVILSAGYDGIRYKSAMHKGGFNLVFFGHEKLEILGATKLVKVTANRLDYVQATDDDLI